MRTEWLYWRSEWLLAIGLLAFLLAAIDLGFRLGKRLHPDSSKGDSQIGTIQGAMLALVGLLLAFSYSMAASRFDNRKQVLVNEANAIGTAYLRAGVLEEPARGELRELLSEYVEIRVHLYDDLLPEATVARLLAKTEQLQVDLWAKAAAAARAQPESETLALLLAALNDVIDLHTLRLASMRNRVPESVLVLLVLVTALALGLVGYGMGIARQRSWVPTTILAVLITAVMIVVLDLDRPRRGMIQVNQRTMLELREAIDRYGGRP